MLDPEVRDWLHFTDRPLSECPAIKNRKTRKRTKAPVSVPTGEPAKQTPAVANFLNRLHRNR